MVTFPGTAPPLTAVKSGFRHWPVPASLNREGPLEHAVVHEMIHLIAPTDSEQFLALMSRHYPT
jgi:hypothetical protein